MEQDITTNEGRALTRRLPSWLKTPLASASAKASLRNKVYRKDLRTVCREAQCPNRGECEGLGSAAFLILGDVCARDCGFCATASGVPRPVDPDEPDRVAQSAVELGLQHVVVTSVTRDDLNDGGAQAFAQTIQCLRRLAPKMSIEVLIPDLRGSAEALAKILDAAPDVLNHNLETVPRLYPSLRPGASYSRSLNILKFSKISKPEILTKTGIMVGLGEAFEEIEELVKDLASVRCDILTIGQYMQPTPDHCPVARFVPPHEFAEMERMAVSKGIMKVVAGPLVRSSYKAGDLVTRIKGNR
jgi:lipoyl synthase